MITRGMLHKSRLLMPLTGVVCVLVLAIGTLGVAIEAASGQTTTETATDIYYKTEGVPLGPPAPPTDASSYRRYGALDNRTLIWFVTQQHTYFGGFVLALPIFCVILEFAGLIARDRASAIRYDRLARDFLQVALLAFSLTAVVGIVMLGMFIRPITQVNEAASPQRATMPRTGILPHAIGPCDFAPRIIAWLTRRLPTSTVRVVNA